MNPQTIVHLKRHMEMETTQIRESTPQSVSPKRSCRRSFLKKCMKIMTQKTVCQDRFCNRYEPEKTAAANLMAKGESRQEFFSIMNGNATYYPSQ